ncbi:hypothetical protein [Streptomyces sp. NPDC021562]|uniref:hypothetical protein n=1 Tax=Streptomyces sp. NPDC021562 TaxID=3155121 RepID=UPI0033EC7D84
MAMIACIRLGGEALDVVGEEVESFRAPWILRIWASVTIETVARSGSSWNAISDSDLS